MSTPPASRPFRKTRHTHVPGSEVLDVSELSVSYNSSNNINSPAEGEPILAQLSDPRPIRNHVVPLTRHKREAPVKLFVAGSPNAISERKIKVGFKLKKKTAPKSYYYRCKRTPESLEKTIQQLKPNMPPTVVRASGNSNDPDYEEDPGEKAAEIASLNQRTTRSSSSSKSERKRLSLRVQSGSSTTQWKRKKAGSSAVMEVTNFDSTNVVEGEFPKAETIPTKAGRAAIKKKAADKRKYTKMTAGGSPRTSHRKAARPWKWFACQDCVSCLRTLDCGKCGQCRRSDVMATCILRQCITPSRNDDQTPNRLMSDDDESLQPMDSDLSDLEWEDAFPAAQFGDLTPEELWRRWNPEASTCADTDATSFLVNGT
eukprot:CAMPEP_0119015888 /NCGR_PEP_ID=MMETSP1176-20130426/11706_1 /TAXON_ID=265551 /ORGANISM="Synedropsis recta cf, Strain CCMP1620" /LENGTH=371 /DNA_ID=CAMNT_0006969213 /DNA_START=22 /DNA_END=1133 /DNA_ORIENTATION=-